MERKKGSGKGDNSFREIMNVLDNITGSFYILDKEWRFIYVNKAVERAICKKSEELIGKCFWEIFHKSDNLILYHMLSRAFEKQKEVHFEAIDGGTNNRLENHAYPTENGLALIQHKKVLQERKRRETFKGKLTLVRKDGKKYLGEISSKVSNADEENENLSQLQFLKNSIVELLSYHSAYVVWDCRENIGVLCQIKEINDEWKTNMQVAAQIKEIICSYAPHLTITIGVSNVHNGPGSLAKSYQEAWSAVISAQCQGKNKGGIYYYQDLGLFQLLAAINGKEYAAEYVRKKIGSLIEYDCKRGTTFLPTLDKQGRYLYCPPG